MRDGDGAVGRHPASRPQPRPEFPHHRLQGFNYADSDHAYFVTICAADRATPFKRTDMAQTVVDSLMWLRQHRGVSIYAYCLMPDHLHLLLQLPARSAPLGTIVGSMKSFTTHESWKLGRRGTLWQERFYDHIVRKSEDGERIALYILENPVRKGLVVDADEWKWSGRPDPL